MSFEIEVTHGDTGCVRVRHTDALITVAVCSGGRCELLRKLLLLLFAQQGQSLSNFKIIVVENSDDSEAYKALADEFEQRQNLSILRSSPPGLSRARNAALSACKTPYIVYLDDDAAPKSGWIDAILSAFKQHDPTVVAGPIYPDWPGEQPDWLPQKYIACLTILDYGNEDRWLSNDEFAYGANMAFKVDALREVGGFNIGLGRRGGPSLLSEEEIETQLMLRKRGYRTLYAAAAAVTHMVYSNRLTRNFFRARMAWQAVSSLLREPATKHFENSQRDIRAAANRLGIEEFVARLMTCKDADSFSAQLDLIYHLFAVFLEAKDLDDRTVETALASAAPMAGVGLAGVMRKGLFDLRAPILPTTRHLIVEGQPAHFFLYALYGGLPRTQLLLFPHLMWHDFNAALAYIQRSITSSLETLTFLTLEPLIYSPNRAAFLQLVQTSGLSCLGILHRLPENARQEEALRDAARCLAEIIVFAEELVEMIQQRYGISSVRYLPLHAPVASYVARNRQKSREKIGATETQVVFSILGEARRGKGIDLLLEALDHVPPDDLHDMFFIIAGRSQSEFLNIDTIAQSLARKNTQHYLDLRSSIDPLRCNVLSEREFGEYIAASDVGVLLYQHEQRNCMSGVAPNYIWGNKPLIALADSVIGRVVAHHELGMVIDEETPQAVARALCSALERHRQGWAPSRAYIRYRMTLGSDSVLAALGGILNGVHDASGQETP